MVIPIAMKKKVAGLGGVSLKSGLKSFWDTRYDTDSFVYGREPNGFFADSINELAPGRALLPGEGEASLIRYIGRK